MGTQEYEVYAQADDIYFDTLYTINSNLVNADRDFYQAMIAATETEAEALQSMSASFENMLILLHETEEGNRQKRQARHLLCWIRIWTMWYLRRTV